MCGIVGIAATGALAGGTVERMLDRVAHRGPDGRGVLATGATTLGHARLAVVAPDDGHQPILSEDGQTSLVANAEIYNHVELRGELERVGHRFATHSDCEVALHGYEDDPEGFVHRLCGMFALALYDAPRDELHLVRDRLGIKPLFYADTPRGVLFASELPALLDVLDPRPTLDPLALAEYVRTGYVRGAGTPFREIRQVLPGQRVVVRGGVIVRRELYWDVASVEPARLGRRAAEEQLEALMGLVVRQHTRTDTPYGLFLSGGVDSAVTLAMLREQNGGRLQTYSVGFPGSGVYDELDDARRMAERFGTEHTQVEVPEAELVREIPNVAAAVGDLMGDYASLPTMLLARRAARDVKVIFSGEGGDEVFAGYGRYRPHAVKRLRQRLAARASRKVEPLEGGIEFLRPEVAARWREATRQAPTPWGLVSEIAPGMLGRQLVDFRTRLPSFLLAKVDRVLMHHGIEGRVPFLDHRIVEFGLALPDSLKVRWRAGKYLLKKWAERRLPREALWREKQGFRVPIERILSAPVRAALAERLHGQHVLGELLDLERLDPVLATRQLPGDYALVVWRLLVLSAWHDSVMVMGSSARSG